MDREIISFIVPAYNAEVTLHRTIQSILNQTSDSYRIIIINDGSTDKT
ncbi:glycosyltransferase family 2 protein, partial [Klebsiella oxytoca]